MMVVGTWSILQTSPGQKARDKNFGNFGRFFVEISFFDAGGKEIQVEKSFEKKSWKNREKSPIFR